MNLINNEVKNQQNIIRKILENDDNIITENHKISIIFQLDTFLETLKSIQYSVMLARLNIISKLILTPKEIETIANEISSQGLEMHNLDDASDYLTTSVFYREPKLMISVNIPRLLPVKFNKVIIEPLPLLNRTVKLVYKTAFINPQRMLAITS